MKSNDSISSHDNSAADYDRQAVEYDWIGPEVLFGLAYEYIQPGESLLDIGIGTGLSSVLFHKAGLRVFGMDGSSEMLKVCESKRFTNELKRHDLLSCPLPYPSDFFNHVISLAVFHFFGDLEPVFEEVARIIKKGGIFGFSVEVHKPGRQDGYASHKGDDISERIDKDWGVRMFSHSEDYIEKLLHRNGFSVLKKPRFAALKYPSSDEVFVLKIFIAQRGKS